MNRRSLLCTVTGIISVSLAGCGDGEQTDTDEGSTTDEESNTDPITNSDSNDKSSPRNDPGNSDENDDELSDKEYPGEIIIYLSVDKPKDAPVLNAEEDSLLENDNLGEALQDAYESYEEGMESKYDSDDRFTLPIRLSHVYVDLDEIYDLEKTLDTNKESNNTWYVEYEEILFTVFVGYPPA